MIGELPLTFSVFSFKKLSGGLVVGEPAHYIQTLSQAHL